MSDQDIRWIQRMQSFTKVLNQLSKFIEKSPLNELEKLGLIHSFENTYELGWTLLKDFFEAQGETDIHGSRDAIRLAFRRGLIDDGHAWMHMVRSSTLANLAWQEDVAEKIATAVKQRYYGAFMALQTRLQHLAATNA